MFVHLEEYSSTCNITVVWRRDEVFYRVEAFNTSLPFAYAWLAQPCARCLRDSLGFGEYQGKDWRPYVPRVNRSTGRTGRDHSPAQYIAAIAM